MMTTSTNFDGAVSGENIAAGLHASQGGSINVNFNGYDSSNTVATACRRELFLTDPSEDRKKLKRKKGDRVDGTCDWILETDELIAWLGLSKANHPGDQETHLLWLHGNPGTGKSTMAIFLTEQLPKDFSKTDGKTLAFFFCDSSFNERRTATSILRGLLHQFIDKHPQLLDCVLPEYKERGKLLFESFDALWEILMIIAADQNTGQKYCIIDALDECDREEQEILLNQLQETYRHQELPQNIKILVTSRPYPEIWEYLEEFENKDLASFPHAKQDITRFIKQRTESLCKKKRYTEKVKSQIGYILRDKAESTFLWIGLACKELEHIPSKDAVRTLKDMHKGLHSFYKRLIKTALEQADPGDKDQIQRILSFVAVCRRPLSVLELSEACKLYQDEEDIETRIQFTRDQISSCRLMVVIQDERVLLLHQSVKDFLVGADPNHLINEIEAHAQLAYRCVSVLIEKFHSGDEAYVNFSEYATKEWVYHAHIVQSKFEVEDSQKEFFEIESPSRQYWLESYRQLDRLSSIPKEFSILHIAAKWGIPALVNNIFYSDGEHYKAEDLVNFINITDSSGLTPLEWAVQSEYTSVISILLDLGGKITAMAVRCAAANEKSGKEVMTLLLNHRGNQFTITEGVVKTAAENRESGREVMKLLLDYREDQVTITEEIVKSAAGNWTSGKEIMTLLLDYRGDQVIITEEVVKAAARNWASGREVIALLLNRRGGQVTITEEIVKAAAENTESGKEVIELLLVRRGDQVTITEEVVKTAAKNIQSGKEIITLLLDCRGDEVIVTEEVVKAAAKNMESGKEIMTLLLNRRGEQVIITEDIVKIAANNEQVMELLLDQRGDQVIITEEVLKVAADDEQVMELLLGRREDQLIITEDVLKAAVNNKQAMALILRRGGDQITITEEIVKAAAGSWRSEREDMFSYLRLNYASGTEAMALLLEQQGDRIIITEEVLKATARNQRSGKEIMELLLEQRGDQITITEEIVKVAANNVPVMELLLDRRGDRVAITEGVLKAAARCWPTRARSIFGRFDPITKSSDNPMELLLSRRGDQITITEEVLKVAARNLMMGKEIMASIINKQGNRIAISEGVLKAAAGNQRSGKEIMALLLNHQGDQIDITEGVLKVTAGNRSQGKEIMQLLLNQQRNQVPITETILKVAAGNLRQGKDIIALLLNQGNQITITEEVVKAAAGNEECGKEVMILLFDRQRGQIKITEAVLETAATCGQDAILELLSHERPIHDKWRSISNLYNAAKTGDVSAMERLLCTGTEPDLGNINNQTPLWIAAKHGHDAVVKVLAQRKDVDINSRSHSGWSPIFWPSWEGDESVVNTLLEAGADANLVDEGGETAITVARRRGHETIAKILEQSVKSSRVRKASFDEFRRR